MSYDVSIIIQTSDAGRFERVGDDSDNYTSNVGPMFRTVMPGPYLGGGRYDGVGESQPCAGLPGLSGLPCKEAAPILEAAIAAMVQRRAEMEALNTPNGWGDYAGALDLLRRTLAACRRHDRCTLAVSW